MSKKSVTLAAPYTDAEGKNHKADSTVEVDVHEANRLLHAGLAREADNDEKKG